MRPRPVESRRKERRPASLDECYIINRKCNKMKERPRKEKGLLITHNLFPGIQSLHHVTRWPPSTPTPGLGVLTPVIEHIVKHLTYQEGLCMYNHAYECWE